ncbi:hypothetical protein GCK72_005027 [Caenorhabditis remanei]|uniref:Uncharacterized protein n=1 Tax=Caenorhabditis remanei TaxID=31234 RepID=A0A6A5HE37_CAERE|nr:hypothetical protein GCK72_005027 [Caenorhabditis remanei]KAF1765076.1 hypothetical protein GCK72_005027 [Caenorhabditis remanei]
MSAIPTNTPTTPESTTDETCKCMISQKECETFQGKLKCLRTLKMHPRASQPELKKCFNVLETAFSSIISARQYKLDKEIRKQILKTIEDMKFFENKIIRVILQGDLVEGLD